MDGEMVSMANANGEFRGRDCDAYGEAAPECGKEALAQSCAPIPTASAEPWVVAKEMLMRDFGIDSAFVRVKTVAQILGVSQNLVYAWIREDRFFLPHRMFNSAAAVKLEDLARWYCDPDGGPDSLEPRQTPEERHARKEELRRERRAREKARGDLIAAKVFEKLGMEQPPGRAARRKIR